MNRLQKSFEILVQAQQEFRQELSLFSNAQAAFRPDRGKWNALQVLDHLIELEKSVYLAARTNLKSATMVDKVSPLAWVKFYLARFVMSTSRRFQMPAGMPEPQARKTLDALRQDWLDMREKWKKYIAEVGPEKLPLQAWRHPVFGPMTLGMAIELLAAHVRHHIHQLRRLRRHPDFPAD
ncbi:MAG: hypothetical protein Kow0059_05490 [Candidatus Sumerlaeia bacterium]